MEKNTSQPLLVLDEALDLQFPRNFRSTLRRADEGLSELKFMSSGQFSERTLLEAIKPIKEKIWIIDLRRESHGYVNGIPISWYGEKNRTNLGLSNQEILNTEISALTALSNKKTVIVNQILEKEQGVIRKTKELTLQMQAIESEAQLAQRLHLGYLRIGVLDHHHPDKMEVDNFVTFVKNLPEDNWLYFHCRGGKGRSTTFVLMYDILKNGKKLSLNNIAQRQIWLGSKDLFKIKNDNSNAWKKEAAQGRKEFIEKFYDYVRSDEGYPKITWSQWLNQHP